MGNHESKYIFRLSLLNCGMIANGMGLLRLPKLKRVSMSGKDSFIGRSDVDCNAIAYKHRGREKERLQKIKANQQKKAEKEERKRIKLEKQKVSGTLDLGSDHKRKKQRKKSVGNKK